MAPGARSMLQQEFFCREKTHSPETPVKSTRTKDHKKEMGREGGLRMKKFLAFTGIVVSFHEAKNFFYKCKWRSEIFSNFFLDRAIAKTNYHVIFTNTFGLILNNTTILKTFLHL
jgi:hypothetical protein